jgi:hypothetical protein
MKGGTRYARPPNLSDAVTVEVTADTDRNRAQI